MLPLEHQGGAAAADGDEEEQQDHEWACTQVP